MIFHQRPVALPANEIVMHCRARRQVSRQRPLDSKTIGGGQKRLAAQHPPQRLDLAVQPVAFGPHHQCRRTAARVIQAPHQDPDRAAVGGNRGEPIVAIVGVDKLEAMKEFRERQRQKDALERLKRLRSRIQARIRGKLTDKEADEIADRFSREFIEDLERTGKIKFEKTAS